MILLTSLLMSLAPLAWQPLPLSQPNYETEDQRYKRSEHTLESNPSPHNVDKSQGNIYDDSYFGQEHNPYTEDYKAAPSAPPTPLNEPIPPQPYNNYVWVPGYWDWQYDHWRWVYGEWQQPPFENAKWEGGHWEKREEKWYWNNGRWK